MPLIEDLHGAITRVLIDATAISHRTKGFNLLIPSVWLDPADTEVNIAWTRRAFGNLQPSSRTAATSTTSTTTKPSSAAVPSVRHYGPNYERLVDVKTRYDPENLFHHNFNIVPR